MVTHEIRIESDDVIHAITEWIGKYVTCLEGLEVSVDIRSYGGATIKLKPKAEELADGP